jgi:exopolysaccharide production protein ExoQ
MLISIAWSEIPFVSFKRWTRELVAVVMALVVMTEDEPREAVLRLFKRVIVILIPFSLLLIKYYPKYGIEFGRWSGEGMWIGAAMQKNGLGRLSIFSVFYLLWSFARRREGFEPAVSRYQTLADISVLAISLWLLKATPGSYSATAIVALAAALTVFVCLVLMRKRRIRLEKWILPLIVVLLIGFAILTVLAGGTTVASATATLGRNTTLTGRTDVWAVLVSVFQRKPILGSGFGSFWTSKSREFFDIPDAHSGYLDVLLELGLTGIVLLTIFLVAYSRKYQRRLSHDFYWASLCICYLIMALAHNISESSFNSFGSHLTAVLLFLSVAVTGDSLVPEEYELQGPALANRS